DNNGVPTQSPQSSLGSNQRDRPSNERVRRPSYMGSSDPQTDSNSPSHTVARADIRASAEKILYTFLLANSEREITLPDSITREVISAIESGRVISRSELASKNV